MKKVLLIALLFVASQVWGNGSQEIFCELKVPEDQGTYLNGFTLEAEVEYASAGPMVEGKILQIQNTDAGFNRVSRIFKDIKFNGTWSRDQSGASADSQFIHLELKPIAPDSEIEILILNVNYQTPMSSRVRMKDGRVYFSSCNSL